MHRCTLEYMFVALGYVLCGTLSHLSGVPTWGMPASFLVLLIALYRTQFKTPAEHRTRAHADRGLWMITAFPFAIYCSGSLVHHEDTFRLVEIVAGHTLLLSLTTAYYAPSSLRVIISSSVLTLMLTSLLTQYSVINSFIASLVCSIVFCYSRDKLKLYAGNSFTDGELISITQGISVFATCSVICFFSTIQISKSASFLQGGLFALGVLIFVLFRFPVTHCNILAFLATCFGVLGFGAYPLCYWNVQEEPLTFFSNFLFQTNGKRITILGFWLGLSVAATIFAGLFAHKMDLSKIAMRKVFHLFIIAVFTVGAVFDPELTYLASGCILGLMIVIEIFRVLKIEPVSTAIRSAFSTFLDEKDTGPLVLSHIYLLIGCCIPFLLYPGRDYSKPGCTLALLTGVTTLGVGDTVAAIFGRKYGTRKWTGTKKTVEGTLAAILSQLLFCMLFAPPTADLIFIVKLLVVVTLTSCLEATTSQIDNLAVPLFAFPLFITLL